MQENVSLAIIRFPRSLISFEPSSVPGFDRNHLVTSDGYFVRMSMKGYPVTQSDILRRTTWSVYGRPLGKGTLHYGCGVD